MSRRTDRRTALESPKPRDVPGYLDAYDRGLLPQVPVNPPSGPAPGLSPTASAMLWRSLARAVAIGAPAIAFVFGVAPRVEVPFGLDLFIGVVVVCVWMWAFFFRWMRQPFERMVEECLHGYATITLLAGSFGGQRHSAWSGTEVGMPWDFSGVWVLNGRFDVKSAPSPAFHPPGLYPSPHEAGRWELWTGVAWSGTCQDGPIRR